MLLCGEGEVGRRECPPHKNMERARRSVVCTRTEGESCVVKAQGSRAYTFSVAFIQAHLTRLSPFYQMNSRVFLLCKETDILIVPGTCHLIPLLKPPRLSQAWNACLHPKSFQRRSPPLGSSDEHFYEHGRTTISRRFCVRSLWVYIQKWNCWIMIILFYFERLCCAVSHRSCTILHFHQQWTRV